MDKPTDSKLIFIKFTRGVSYFVYGFAIVAAVFLGFGFFLLLFGANQSTPFVQFIYKVAAEFLQPFRGIFPLHPVGETGYFSAAALFAIMVYLILAAAVNALISYLTAKMVRHENELESLERHVRKEK